MPPAHSRLVVLCVVAVALACVPSWPLSAAPDQEEDVNLTLGESPGFTNSLGMKFVRVRAGKFMMGAPDGESGAESFEKPRHEVTLTKDFYLCIHEVTQKQYRAVTGNNPSYFCAVGGGKDRVKGLDTDDFPVESVSWHDAQGFLKALNALPAEKKHKVEYRLPTEAQWEYACRGGHKIKDLGAGARLPFLFQTPSDSLGDRKSTRL